MARVWWSGLSLAVFQGHNPDREDFDDVVVQPSFIKGAFSSTVTTEYLLGDAEGEI
jgi:hypothetical protein